MQMQVNIKVNIRLCRKIYRHGFPITS